MVWDFAEAFPFVSSSGGWSHNLEFLLSPLEAEAKTRLRTGQVERGKRNLPPVARRCRSTPSSLIRPTTTQYRTLDLSDYFHRLVEALLSKVRFSASESRISHPRNRSASLTSLRAMTPSSLRTQCARHSQKEDELQTRGRHRYRRVCSQINCGLGGSITSDTLTLVGL